MKVEIDVNQEQLEMIRELLNLSSSASDSELIEEFIIENTGIDEDGNEF